MNSASLPSLGLALLFAGATGCRDTSGPGPTPLPSLPGLVVSAPVLGAGGAAASVPPAALSFGSSASETVVYISLAPRSVPDGMEATIRDQATGQSVTTQVVNGGFDPVPLAASVGDTVTVDVTRFGTTDVVRAAVVVAARRPVVVVRTDPPPRKRDVPLNATMVVVFSAPIDPTTLTTSSVQLWRGTVPLTGTVRFADAQQLRAEFHPDSLLAPGTDYRIVVTQGIRDVNGDALASAVEVSFTTATGEPVTGLVFASVSAGARHACGITTNGQPYCWGENSDGQLGNGTTTSSTTPVPVLSFVGGPEGLTVAQLSAGATQTCGVMSVPTWAGNAPCWGTIYTSFQMMVSTYPNSMLPEVSVAQVSAGEFATCWVSANNELFCWGQDFAGQVGGNMLTISVGNGHACGVTSAGAACFGHNGGGQLGDGTTTDRWNPVTVLGGLSFVQVSAGGSHTCGVTTGGTAYCWGWNESGQLGDATTTERTSPVPVLGGLSFVQVSAGGSHTCGVTTGGTAYCWGWNGSGQLGDATTTERTSPVPVLGGLTFAEVSAGGQHSCGVTTAGAAYCWGQNGAGQLGDGTAMTRTSPVPIAGSEPPPPALKIR